MRQRNQATGQTPQKNVTDGYRGSQHNQTEISMATKDRSRKTSTVTNKLLKGSACANLRDKNTRDSILREALKLFQVSPPGYPSLNSEYQKKKKTCMLP